MNRTEALKQAKPILFNTEMVRDILDGRKTKTRRVIKKPYYIDDADVCRVSGFAMHSGTNATDGMPYPDRPYQLGDILYVRETWGCYEDNWMDAPYFLYRADYPDGEKGYWYEPEQIHFCDLPRWRPSIHMPKEAARIFLRVKNVGADRLLFPFYADGSTIFEFQKEGIDIGDHCRKCIETYGEPSCIESSSDTECTMLDMVRNSLKELWNSTIPKKDFDRYGWNANPWVWMYEFERIEVTE